jgi:cold shock CspA family protein
MIVRTQGTICNFVPSRGFGFISFGTGNTFQKWFFHLSQFPKDKTPEIGMNVSFTVAAVQQGRCPAALDIQIEGGAL